MKKIFMIIALAAVTMTASAQQEVGTFSVAPRAGVNIMTLAGNGGIKAKVGFVAGADVFYQATEKFALSLGAAYSMQGCSYKDEYKAAMGKKWNMNYLNIPVMAHYNIVGGLSVNAGVQPGFLLSAKMKDTALGDIDFKDATKKFDLTIPVGVSYEVSNVVFDARYNIGLTKTLDGDDVDKSQNRGFQFTIGYKIGL